MLFYLLCSFRSLIIYKLAVQHNEFGNEFTFYLVRSLGKLSSLHKSFNHPGITV